MKISLANVYATKFWTYMVFVAPEEGHYSGYAQFYVVAVPGKDLTVATSVLRVTKDRVVLHLKDSMDASATFTNENAEADSKTTIGRLTDFTQVPIDNGAFYRSDASTDCHLWVCNTHKYGEAYGYLIEEMIARCHITGALGMANKMRGVFEGNHGFLLSHQYKYRDGDYFEDGPTECVVNEILGKSVIQELYGVIAHAKGEEGCSNPPNIEKIGIDIGELVMHEAKLSPPFAFVDGWRILHDDVCELPISDTCGRVLFVYAKRGDSSDQKTAIVTRIPAGYLYLRHNFPVIVYHVKPTELDKRRSFPSAFRFCLWETRPHICGICGEEIKEFDDCQVDHIIPWSKGGRTIPENAQLTHARCNASKGNRED